VSFARKLVEVDIPRLSKAGWLRHQQKVLFLSGAAGAVSNLQSNKVRFAIP
jgi:hypothetical protein